MLESNSLTYTLVLPKGRIYEVQQYIHYCPMCGRPLNEEVEKYDETEVSKQKGAADDQV